MKILFEEEQKYRQWWLWVLLLALAVLPFIEIVQPFLTKDLENMAKVNPLSTIILLLPLVLTFLLFYFLKLKTTITQDSIAMQYSPFLKRNYKWSEIESAEIIDYGFVGGWGIRMWTKYGTVYNVAGSKGIQLKPKDGKAFVIGSQNIEELEKVLKEIKIN